MALAGLELGRLLGTKIGERGEALGGIVLVSVGIAIASGLLFRSARARLSHDAGRKRRSRRLLVTTKTELNAIAAAAISGLRNPSAASGIAATL